MRVECRGISRGQWQGLPCFVISLGRILEIKNYEKNRVEENLNLALGDAQEESAISNPKANGFAQEVNSAGRVLCADSCPANFAPAI